MPVVLDNLDVNYIVGLIAGRVAIRWLLLAGWLSADRYTILV